MWGLGEKWSQHGQLRTPLAVRWLRIQASTAGGAGSIPDQGTKIPRAAVWPKKTPKKQKPWAAYGQFGTRI